MGALRLFLAISVVVGHTAPLFGLQMLPASEAVRTFFMISGFYMALILDGKYRGRPFLFYSNRAVRIYPTYWLCLLVTLAVMGRWPLAWLHGLPLLAAGTINVAIFGQDIALQMQRHGWSIIGSAWTLGTELLFYLVAPWFARSRFLVLALAAAASLALQLYVDSLQPWTSYFLFPANLCFFLYGMLAHRAAATPWFERLNARLGGAAALAALALLLGREFIPFYRNYSWMHYAVAVGGMPFLFAQAKALKWDRRIGELSYPVYLLHPAAMTFAAEHLGKTSPENVLLLTLPAAVLLAAAVELPLGRWRQARVEAAERKRPGRVGPIGAPGVAPAEA